MRRETIIFTTCGFLLGLTIGSLVIGPKLAQSKLAGGQPAGAGMSEAPPQAAPTGTPAGGNPMEAVQQQLAKLKDAIVKNPNDVDALVQLGDMYMDATKFPQAAEYLERAVAVRDDANVRTDLGICYKQTGDLGHALTEFQRAVVMAPDQWQPLFNEAIVLVDLHRKDEARALTAKLQQMRPGDPEVQKLVDTVK